ncbi:heat shock transcription factor, X-linked member 3-like [Meriones unguiculatus]|uniref:heat shock transcription factor, X-linked member 3-like n=1 Tax=Meriones unguiculatus TaxID=10047 RepID=UPI00293EB487|nr:heat shock transcription factor, X-linked member 3-like [Meriones unguiculatus]XP_060230667.1 heat shock transcription factor, X-linked member 3-like [Meriones unguiculatus]
MASQNDEEESEANKNPVFDQEPERNVLPNALPDSAEESKEDLARQEDQDVIQSPAFKDNPPAEDESQPTGDEEGDTDLLSLPFPRKLWIIVQNEAFESVSWNEEGDAILIKIDLFQREVLHRKGTKKIFETDSLNTFIHQLNLYGFRNIYPEASTVSSGENGRIMMYCNVNFQRDKPALLEYLWGKEDLGNLPHQVICVPVPLSLSQEPTSKKKKVLPTRYSPRFYHKAEEEDGEEESKKKIVYSTVWAMKSVPGSSLEKQSPGESSNPTAEDTSGNIVCVPPADPGTEGTEEVPHAHSSEHPILGSMMSLYNNSCSVLLSALSKRPANESPDEEEQEGSSDYKCVTCESIRNRRRL